MADTKTEKQHDGEMMRDMPMNGQDKESLLLIQNSDLSEYSLLSVMGMDVAEIVEALSVMNDADKLSIAAYLESRGAWTTEVANEGTREFREYHLDVRYNTDTNEIVDLRAKKELDERAKAEQLDVEQPESSVRLSEQEADIPKSGDMEEGDEFIDLGDEREKVLAEMKRLIGNEQGIIENFRAKTNEMFHEISEMNPAEIEDTVKCHVQAKLEECGIDAVIVDAVVVGSRCRGLERVDSDIDVVVELSTDEREDVLFDTFNGDGLHIGGVKVDINPITAQRTGTLETYLPQAEDYLTEMREAREKEPVSIFSIRMNDEERWFKNTSGLDAEGLCKAYAECGRPFVEMGKYGQRIEAADYANTEQGDRLDFSIEFNEETDQITIFDGQSFEHKGLRTTLFPEQAEPEVTLIVAECGEFLNVGECHEDITSVDEAIAIWRQIPPERMHGIPSIDIKIHVPGTEPVEDVVMIVLFGETIDIESLDEYPAIKENARAMELITELVAKLPDMEIAGIMSMEMEEAVWEKRMPNLTPAEQLAVEIDRFFYNYGWIDYSEDAGKMTKSVSYLAETISQNNSYYIVEWLSEAILEGTEPEEIRKAKELIDKLAEYKPLAKIEEMEEQNYNMVDDVLNNGTEEKLQKGENPKEQEHPAARTSLKARLAEKKEIVSGQGKGKEEQENVKNDQKEI